MGAVISLERRRRPAPNWTGGPPPHDLNAEAAVLTTVLTSAAGLEAVLPLLGPEHFYSEANARIYQVAQQLAADKTPVDLVTVNRRLKDAGWPAPTGDSWSSYLARVVDETPATTNAPAYARILLDRWRLRQAIAICHRTAAEGYEAVDSIALIDGARTELTALAQTATTCNSGALVEDALVELWSDMMRHGEAAKRGLAWGYRSCDRAFGRLAGGQMTVLAARAGCGKTSFAWHVAEHVALKPEDEHSIREAVFFVSAEMSVKTLVGRQVAIRARVPAERIEDATCTESDFNALTRAQKEMGYLSIVIDDFDGKAPTPGEIQERVRDAASKLAAGTYRARRSGRLYPRARLRLVVVDYLQRLKSPLMDRYGATREQHVAAISTGLSDLSKALDVHVLALAQAGLHGEDSTKDLTMRDIRESGRIEADADTIIFMTKPERNHVKLCHAKARHRSIAENPVWLNTSRGTFWEDE